jgi:hypothetical protein
MNQRCVADFLELWLASRDHELAAIAVHEKAAALHSVAARRFCWAALNAPDRERAAVLTRRGTVELLFADAARQRAQNARARLAAKGG